MLIRWNNITWGIWRKLSMKYLSNLYILGLQICNKRKQASNTFLTIRREIQSSRTRDSILLISARAVIFCFHATSWDNLLFMQGPQNKICTEIYYTVTGGRFSIIKITPPISIIEPNQRELCAAAKKIVSESGSKVSKNLFNCLPIVFLRIMHVLTNFVDRVSQIKMCDCQVLQRFNKWMIERRI